MPQSLQARQALHVVVVRFMHLAVPRGALCANKDFLPFTRMFYTSALVRSFVGYVNGTAAAVFFIVVV